MNSNQQVIVFAGPSVGTETVQKILPECALCPPIRRGDLYREREQGGTHFLILDGVLFQEPALPPREILDVLEDGAIVVGAASMGALRAAECWPAGMLGVGTIYRLFRRGCLDSDDEVVLTFAAEDDYRPLSAALINIRFALRRAVRTRRLSSDRARSLVRHAEALHFSKRRWPELLDRAGIEDRGLASFLASQDLKRQDSVRALRRVRHLTVSADYEARPRENHEPFVPSEAYREQTYDPTSGFDPSELKSELARWHLISGRYLRHIAAVAAAAYPNTLAGGIEKTQGLSAILDALTPSDMLFGAESSGRQAGQQSVALRWVLMDLWKNAATDEFASSLWAELAMTGELAAELFRWRAIKEGAAWALRRGLKSRRCDRFLAESEIAHEHGFPSWRILRQNRESAPYPWSEFEAYRDQLALAKRLREHLFNFA